MKPGKKKVQPSMYQKNFDSNEEFGNKPVKKGHAKRNQKLSIYDRMDEDEDDLELDLYSYEEESYKEEDEL